MMKHALKLVRIFLILLTIFILDSNILAQELKDEFEDNTTNSKNEEFDISKDDKIKIAYVDVKGSLIYKDLSLIGGYLQEVLNDANVGKEITYIKGTKEECFEYLEKDMVDFVYSYSDDFTFSSDYIMSVFPFLDIEAGIYKLGADKDSLFGEINTLDKKSIGVIYEDMSNEFLYNFIKDNKIDITIYEYNSHEELLKALDNKNVDFIYSVKSIEDKKYRLINNISTINMRLYSKEDKKEILNEFNDKLYKKQKQSPMFLNNIRKKYYGNPNNVPVEFTKDEVDYLNSKDYTFTVYFSNNYKPLMYFNEIKEEYEGIIHNVFNEINKITDIKFEYINFDYMYSGVSRLDNNKADILASYIKFNKESNSYNYSKSIMEARLLVVGLDENKNEYYNKKEKVFNIATVESSDENYKYLLSLYPDSNVVRFTNVENCLDSVLSGKTDFALIENLTFNEYSGIEEYKIIELYETINTETDVTVLFSNDAGKIAIDIFNKSLNYIREEDFDTYRYSYLTKVEQITLRQVLDKYTYVVVRFGLLIVFAIISLFVIENIRKKSLLNMVAYTDSVTGVMNYTKFKQNVANLIKNSPKNHAFVMFDINKFKFINDKYGTLGGDKILKYIAKEIQKDLQKDEYISRRYADVFCLLITYEHDSDIISLIEKINTTIKNSSLANKLNASFGIYKIGDEDLSIDQISDRALMAKNIVKGNTFNSYAFYDKGVGETILFENRLENRMEFALENGEFEVYYQPQYCANNNKIIAAEALVRWNNPIEGFLLPGKFIDIFEKNNFILKLDFYVWEQVFKVIKNWIDLGRKPFPISINVSRAHLLREEFVYEIMDLVNLYQIPKEYIELEITETIFVEDEDNITDIIEDLSRKGFTIALDDFGSGYSSLNILNKLPIDILKIDRGFLNEVTHSKKGRVILDEMIGMAKKLDMIIVCEGVETEEQIELLKKSGSDRLQGFYFSKPISLLEFENKVFS